MSGHDIQGEIRKWEEALGRLERDEAAAGWRPFRGRIKTRVRRPLARSRRPSGLAAWFGWGRHHRPVHESPSPGPDCVGLLLLRRDQGRSLTRGDYRRIAADLGLGSIRRAQQLVDYVQGKPKPMPRVATKPRRKPARRPARPARSTTKPRRRR